MEPLVFDSASQLSVRLRTYDSDGLIIVIVDREAIDGRFKLSASTERLRIGIVMSNLDFITDLVRGRIARKQWKQGHSISPRQVVLMLADLESIPLKDPLYHLSRADSE